MPKVGAEFVADMENVLTTYAKPYDPKYPQVCLDEKVVYLLKTPRGNLPMQSGSCEKQDYEYERAGSLNLFVVVEPKAGYRVVQVHEQRTARDYAQVIRFLVEEVYPQAEQIEIVQDNLNTHKLAALYRTFSPAVARRILDKVKFVYTPKHASWLNMAEIEIGVFERTCLGRRISSRAELEEQIAGLQAERNLAQAKINWQFSCEDARVKLHRLYPKLEQVEQVEEPA